MKTLVARKCKDGWQVGITQVFDLRTESEVLKEIRQRGLIVRKQFSKKGEKIYAD